jgi:hypothetical protein
LEVSICLKLEMNKGLKINPALGVPKACGGVSMPKAGGGVGAAHVAQGSLSTPA